MKKLLFVLIACISFWSCSTSPNNNGGTNTTVIPIAPSNLIGVVVSNSRVNLSWTDNSTNETGFKIERRLDGGNYAVVGNTNADILNYIDSGLTAYTNYTYRVYSYNAVGNSITYSNEFSISTGGVPVLSTNTISTITFTTAVSGGTISNDGGTSVTVRGVVWSTTSNPTINLSTKTSDGNGAGAFNSNISGLNANTTYYLRAYATNSNGTGYGNEQIFITSNYSLPTITTTTVASIGTSTAISGGDISNDGGLPVTSRGVVWSTSSSPTISLSTKTFDGSGTGSFTSNISGLTPNTTYYVRSYATNTNGTSYGENISLTTLPDVNSSHCCGTLNIHNDNLVYGRLTDQDGNIYKTIQIGTQTWMAENLKVRTYRNGDFIQNIQDSATWYNTITGATCWFNNDSTNFNCPYGKLYNYYAVVDSRNLCPTGWHIPSNNEIILLSDYLGGLSAAGGKMKSTSSLWNSPNTGATNSSGFSALPGGLRGNGRNFQGLNTGGVSATNTFVNGGAFYVFGIPHSGNNLGNPFYNLSSGVSVRCLKD